jgi:cytochrome c oxidase subunit 2
VLVGGVVSFAIAPWRDWWLPEDYSTYGHKIDHLFNLILVVTGIVFVGTEAFLVYCLFSYSGPRKAHHIHGHHRAEMIWTLVPGVILFFLAVYQLGAWAEIKYPSRFPPDALKSPIARVTARQFEWRIEYPGADGKFRSDEHPEWGLDDLHVVNDFHVPKGRPVVLELRTMDVLHSFFLPQFRVKQDAVPGLMIPVWFEATKAGQFDLACAELCGWGHYKMRGRLTVHETEEEFQQWLGDRHTEQEYAGEVAEQR